MRVRQQISERGSEFLRSGGAWKICLRQHYLIEQAFQWFDKASMILVAHHPKDKNYRAGRMRAFGAREEVGQGRRGSGIMRAIQQKGRMVIDHLQSSGPVHRTQARSHRPIRDRDSLRSRRS